MISSPSFTNIHEYLSEQFSRLRMQAFRASLLARVYGRALTLKNLSDVVQKELQQKRYCGVQNIQISRIVGTVSRTDDFDTDFRPRKKHLRNRWVSMFILLESDSWSPIVVHKVGEDYFVEDGHHRVSVARAVGMSFIEAEVWDHTNRAVQFCHCPSPRLSLASAVKVCAME